MEKNVRKKRPSGATPGKDKRDRAKSGSRSVTSENITRQSATGSETQVTSMNSVLGMPLDARAARQAVILSEIIGKPVSKRRMKW